MIIGGLPRNEFKVRLRSGRAVTLDEIHLSYTYGDALEGDPSYTSPDAFYRDAVEGALHHFFLKGRAKRGRGIVVVEPDLRRTPPYPVGPHVPYVRALSFCSSWHEGQGSGLALIWFQDSFDEPLYQRYEQALSKVDWEMCSIPWSEG